MGLREDRLRGFGGERGFERDRGAGRFAVGEDDLADVGRAGESRLEDRPERRRDDERLGARIGEHVGILFASQQRIERDRHDPGADCAEKGDREIDRVEHRQRDAILAPQSEAQQQTRKTAGLLLQLPVSQRAFRFDEGKLVGAPFSDVAVDKIGAGVGD
jgi:hypothetical protein